MAVTIPVKDGKIVDETASADSLSSSSKTSNSSLDKEAFLQLLVAQMKYQDPLEPTSNTEYISQLATFSSLEEMQNLRASMEASQAADLVGKTVIMKVSNASGDVNLVTGNVDYVKTENGKVYLSIDDSLYSLDDLDTIVDNDYMDAVNIGEDFEEAVKNLPDVNKLTLQDKENLAKVAMAYDSLTDYQKNYIQKYYSTALEKLTALVDQMNQLVGAAGGSEEDGEEAEGSDGTGDAEEAAGTE